MASRMKQRRHWRKWNHEKSKDDDEMFRRADLERRNYNDRNEDALDSYRNKK